MHYMQGVSEQSNEDIIRSTILRSLRKKSKDSLTNESGFHYDVSGQSRLRSVNVQSVSTSEDVPMIDKTGNTHNQKSMPINSKLAGSRCFKQNRLYSQCRPSCPARWRPCACPCLALPKVRQRIYARAAFTDCHHRAW